jgi:hypothetical protein
MPRPGPTTQAKRNRERAQQERREEKEAKKTHRKENKKDRAQLIADGIDPDLEGIQPGPQPIVPFD